MKLANLMEERCGLLFWVVMAIAAGRLLYILQAKGTRLRSLTILFAGNGTTNSGLRR